MPFMFCFCSICRKTGGGAFGCNIMGIRDTLKVKGERFVRAYHARIRERGKLRGVTLVPFDAVARFLRSQMENGGAP